MSIEGEGAGKGDTYRPVNRAVYNENFDFIFRKKDTVVKWEQCPNCGRSTSFPICAVCRTPIP